MTSTTPHATLLTAIFEAISSALAAITKAGENGITLTEAMTEMIVIDRLLMALGYDPWEIQKQGVAEIGNIPDYAILPNTPHQWFLEAKKWKLPLTDKDASQAVNYAANQGKRWAVLTNGDEWRVLDAFSNTHLSQKCIRILPSLTDDGAQDFFALLAKDAMLTGQLAISHRARIIRDAVIAELSNPVSATVKKLGKDIEEQTGLLSIKKEEILPILLALIHREPQTTVSLPVPTDPPIDSRQLSIPVQSPNELSLLELCQNGWAFASNRKPIAVLFADNSEVSVDDWRVVTKSVIVWILSNYQLPLLPFYNGSTAHTNRYFLNTAPVHPDGSDFCVYHKIEVGETTIYIYLHNSASGFCRRLIDVTKAVGGDPATIRIRFAGK